MLPQSSGIWEKEEKVNKMLRRESKVFFMMGKFEKIKVQIVIEKMNHRE